MFPFYLFGFFATESNLPSSFVPWLLMNTATRAVPTLVPLANGLGVTRLFAAGFPRTRNGKERWEGVGEVKKKKSRRKRGKEGGPSGGGGNAFARRNDRFNEWTDGFVILERKFSRRRNRLDLERLICIHLHGICMAKRRAKPARNDNSDTEKLLLP